MTFLKSIGDGIGTAAGVAWPTFGIIFGSLGLAIGGITAVVLGSLTSGLFLLVALPITLWSYKNYLKEKNQLEQKLINLKNKCITYYSEIQPNNNELPFNKPDVKHLSYNSQFKAGVTGFTAAFGSIAGCGAGTIGMLVGLGVFSGLAAFPVIGWSILGCALIFGLIVAGICIYTARERHKTTQLISHYEETNRALELIIIKQKLVRNAEVQENQTRPVQRSCNDTMQIIRRTRSCDFTYHYRNHSIWDDTIADSRKHPQERERKPATHTKITRR